MKKIIVLIIAIFTINIANAQWQQTCLDSTLVQVLAINGNNIFAGTAGYGVYLSTNNGSNWISINNGLPANSYITAFAFTGNNIFTATNGGVYLSTNNGNSWVTMNNGIPTDFAVSSLAIIGNNIFAGGYEGVYLSTNNGNNWAAVNTGLPTGIWVNSLAVNGNNIIAGAYEFGGVYLSSNYGSNWLTVNNGISDSLNVTTVSVIGNNFFAATPLEGIYLSTDNGNNWNSVDNGLPLGTNYLSIISSGNSIFAGSSGSLEPSVFGVYLSTNNGSSWNAVNTGLLDTNVWTLAVDNNYIYAGTYSHGVWRRPLSEFPSGIKENNLNNNVSIYPNPTKDNLTIETNSNTQQRIEIINLIGQTIYTNIINKKATINTSAFANGLYILKLSSDKETVVRKFIKE
ncbi:MAG: T9SS type A sorting domain-containing protein [Bacteroidota bacterium]